MAKGKVIEGSSFDFREEQENGDNVDCWECGVALNDDVDVIANDDDGFAYHQACKKYADNDPVK